MSKVDKMIRRLGVRRRGGTLRNLKKSVKR